MTQRYVLLASAPDQRGIVAAISAWVAALPGSFVESDQHTEGGVFFMRHEIEVEQDSLELLQQSFAPLAADLQLSWQLQSLARKKRVAVLVSRQDHCLYDLIQRHRNQSFRFDLCAVMSNHRDLEEVATLHHLPFFHVAVPPQASGRAAAFEHMEQLWLELAVDVVVLAKYMQILPLALTQRWQGRLINIHHSMLPAFIGAKPYHQAFERGVKQIGATCHFVTAELDQGPIIEQDVIRVDHRDSVNDLIHYGHDIERTVLARALRWWVEDRIVIHGQRTVVLR